MEILKSPPAPIAVKPACPRACSSCPWRLSNQGSKPDPHKFYTPANLRRLWHGMRNGARMSCHPTDLDLSVRAENCIRDRISVVGQLVQCSAKDLRRWKNIGTLTIREYETALARFGLRLGMTTGEIGGWEWTR
jgi:hypothetical protein